MHAHPAPWENSVRRMRSSVTVTSSRNSEEGTGLPGAARSRNIFAFSNCLPCSRPVRSLAGAPVAPHLQVPLPPLGGLHTHRDRPATTVGGRFRFGPHHNAPEPAATLLESGA